MTLSIPQKVTVLSWVNRTNGSLSEHENINFKALKQMACDSLSEKKGLSKFTKRVQAQSPSKVKAFVLAFIAKIRSFLKIKQTHNRKKRISGAKYMRTEERIDYDRMMRVPSTKFGGAGCTSRV